MKAPTFRFKGYTDDWVQRKLGEVLQFQNGFNGGREAYGEGTAFISVMDILNNQFITYDCIRGKATVTDDELERFSVRYGDVLFQRSSENVEDAGTSNVYVDNERTAIFGGFVIRGRQVAPYSPRFMKYLLDTKAVRNQITKKAQGAQHVNVSQETLQDVQITLPSQREQEAVESCLCNLDNLIALHQRKCDALKDLKKGMLQKMFPKEGAKFPEFRFKGFTGDWVQRKLGDVGNAKSGIGFPDAEQGGEEGIPFFKVSDMNLDGNENELIRANNYVTQEQVKRKRWNVIDDVPAIFFAKVGAAVMLNRKRLVKMPFLLDNNTMAYIFDSNVWDSEFGKTLFETIDLTKLTQVGALPSYNASDVEDISLMMPSRKEQSRIGEYFSNLDTLIALHQRKCDALKELKKGMLQKMFPEA